MLVSGGGVEWMKIVRVIPVGSDEWRRCRA
jgi:hypothetical protein